MTPTPDAPASRGDTPSRTDSAAAPPDAPCEDRFVALDGGRVFVRRWDPPGPGRVDGGSLAAPAPILMLHDSLGSVDIWRDFPSRLCRGTGRPVLAYDRLGFGKSDPRVGRPSLDFVAEEVPFMLALLRALDVGRFVALGHSVGGGMAVELAAARPDACEALITLAAQIHAEDRTLDGIRAAREQFQDPRQVERLARYHGDKTHWVLDAWIGCWLDPGFLRWSVDRALARVRCPVLAIHGDRDEYGSTSHAHGIGRMAGGPVQVEVMQDVGHVPQREQPEVVVARIARFLATSGNAAAACAPGG